MGNKKITPEEALQQKLVHFNWEKVDAYPTFEACKNETSPEKQKHCFVQLMGKHIHSALEKHPIIISDSIHETIYLQVLIDNKGQASLDTMLLSMALQKRIPSLKKWIHSAIDSLPKIYPARKRGVPVATKFRLPIRFVTQ